MDVGYPGAISQSRFFLGISKGHSVNKELTDDRGNAKIALPFIFR